MATCRYCEAEARYELNAGDGLPVCSEHLPDLLPSKLELARKVRDLEAVVAELREQADESDRSGGRA